MMGISINEPVFIETVYLKKEHGLQLLTNDVYIPTLKCTHRMKRVMLNLHYITFNFNDTFYSTSYISDVIIMPHLFFFWK